jgi:hypothetical protein
MPDTAKTAQGMRGTNPIQFSVYVENKVGALLELTSTLSNANVHICGISILDTSDTAVIRIIVDDPQRARQILRASNEMFTERSILAVELPQGPEKLDKVLRALLAAEINIYFIYSLMVRPNGHAVLALHVEDDEYAADVLKRAGFKVLMQEDISR